MEQQKNNTHANTFRSLPTREGRGRVREGREGSGAFTEYVQIISALAMLAFGAGLSIAGFIVEPLGEVSNSVLLIFAQCLIYAGSALGIDSYVNYKLNELKR